MSKKVDSGEAIEPLRTESRSDEMSMMGDDTKRRPACSAQLVPCPIRHRSTQPLLHRLAGLATRGRLMRSLYQKNASIDFFTALILRAFATEIIDLLRNFKFSHS
jgi:hypothetical protein